MYGVKKDIESNQFTNSNMRGDLNNHLSEKDALERHSRILLGQNDDLTKELERFVNTDEVLRQQLDRRSRVFTMQDRNNREIHQSNTKVVEARSRSPERSYQRSSPRQPSRQSYKKAGSPLRSSYKATYNY